jgi:hypothetical protein
MFVNTLSLTFIFKAMDINYQSCPPSYKLLNNPSKTIGLHSTIHIKKIIGWIMCGNYAMYDGFVNGTDGILKISITYCEKTIICIMFQNFKIGTLTRKRKVIITTTLNQNRH